MNLHFLCLAFSGALLLASSLQAGQEEPRGHVVLVHGIYATGKSLEKLAGRLSDEGWVTYCPDLKGSSGQATMGELANQVAGFVDSELPEGEPFHLVGFSLGGIVAKQLVIDGEVEDQVLSLTTIGAPHHGSTWAYLLGMPGVRDLRPGSELLDSQWEADFGTLPILNVWGPLDLMIFPNGSSRWEGQKNFRSWAIIHFGLVHRRAVARAVDEHLSQAHHAHVPR